MRPNKSIKSPSADERSPRTDVSLPAGTLPLKQPPPPKIALLCAEELERTIINSPECSAGVEKPALGVPDIEKRPFKPYANVSSPIEDDLYKMLSQTFSESDSRERPWCGIGLEVGLLAVSPTHVTIADIQKMNGVQQAVVHVPQNWRERWYVETAGGARHELPDNPCDKAERAISSLTRSLNSFLSSNDETTFQSIKYLIIFPDKYTFEGPKEFFIIERDEVLTLKLKNFRDLTETILMTAQSPRMDSRGCRAWLEGNILKKSDDSILGTWLDVAFDKVESEPAKNECRRLGYLRHKKMLSKKGDVASTESLLMNLTQPKFTWLPSKLIVMVVTGMIIGMGGWRFYDSNKPPILGSRSNKPVPLSPPANRVNAAGVDEVATPQNRVSLLEIQNRDTVVATEVRQSSEQKKPGQPNDSAKKLSEEAQAFEKSGLKREKLVLQIDKAIRLRAISGVTVHIVEDTAHLEGRVATESQKAAAEKAARGVPGVKDIRSSIKIDFLSSGDS